MVGRAWRACAGRRSAGDEAAARGVLSAAICNTGGRGLILSAPSSGSGKSLVTMGLLRHLRRAGLAVAAAKVGPDYIDPAFHSAAIGGIAWNLDPWAMRPSTIARILGEIDRPGGTILCEGVMGLFDGTGPDGDEGSTAAVAEATGWPVVLIVDVRGMTGSVAALVRGFATHKPAVQVAGVILNRVGSARHAALVTDAIARSLPQIRCLGHVLRDTKLALEERHLGLVQAGEQAGLEAFLDHAGDTLAAAVDVPALVALARSRHPAPPAPPGEHGLSPPGQRIAVARDTAFAFAYPHLLEGWRRQGAEIAFFSPLADEPPPDCDAIYLPGGYPELHGAGLAAARRFREGMHAAGRRGLTIYGECGGYMALGRTLIDLDGRTWPMLDMLPVDTGFAPRRLSLGYRTVTAAGGPTWLSGGDFRGHEFHYASVLSADVGTALFADTPVHGSDREVRHYGHRQGTVAGSFIHLIDAAA